MGTHGRGGLNPGVLPIDRFAALLAYDGPGATVVICRRMVDEVVNLEGGLRWSWRSLKPHPVLRSDINAADDRRNASSMPASASESAFSMLIPRLTAPRFTPSVMPSKTFLI